MTQRHPTDIQWNSIRFSTFFDTKFVDMQIQYDKVCCGIVIEPNGNNKSRINKVKNWKYKKWKEKKYREKSDYCKVSVSMYTTIKNHNVVDILKTTIIFSMYPILSKSFMQNVCVYAFFFIYLFALIIQIYAYVVLSVLFSWCSLCCIYARTFFFLCHRLHVLFGRAATQAASFARMREALQDISRTPHINNNNVRPKEEKNNEKNAVLKLL